MIFQTPPFSGLWALPAFFFVLPWILSSFDTSLGNLPSRNKWLEEGWEEEEEQEQQ